jgi:HEPN domain-containing protein
MDEAKRDEIQQWLLKSKRNLTAARLLFESEASLLDVVVYHCQQSAEKALKAYLTYHDVLFQKTHNLIVLLDVCYRLNLVLRVFK